ncbi:hypothetical protein QJQ45_027207, partial [Haematococcus lacustris]
RVLRDPPGAMVKKSARIAGSVRKSLKEASDSDSDSEEELVAASDDSSENDRDEQPAKRSRKAAAPKPAPAPIALTLTPTAAPPTTPKRKKGVPEPSIKDLSLLGIGAGQSAWSRSHSSQGPLPLTVQEWAARYAQAACPATAELLTLLVQVAGAFHTVTEEEVEEGDVEGLVNRLAAGVKEHGGADPLRDRRSAKSLGASFPAFWRAFVKELHDAEALLGRSEDFALDKVLHTVFSLSGSNVRAFRLAATLAAAALVTALVGVRLTVTSAMSHAQFQKEAEERKGRAAQAAVLGTLKANVDSYHRQVEGLSAIIDNVVNTVFGVRFRDTQADIRGLVIRAIGSWLLQDPVHFLVDAHLKYLGWALSDRDEGVRLSAVSALHQLYKDAAHVPALRSFKSMAHCMQLRFLERLRELPYDVKESVAEVGLQLLGRLVSLGEMERSAVREVYGLLGDESPRLRAAAAGLSASLIQEEAKHAVKAAAGAATRTGKAGTAAAGLAAPLEPEAGELRSAEVTVLLDVLSWLQSVDQAPTSNGHAANGQHTQPNPAAASDPQLPLDQGVVRLLVGALYDLLPAVRDVPCLVSVLSSDQLSERKVGGQWGAAHLAAILAASLQLAARATGGQGELDSARKASKSKAATAKGDSHQEGSLALMAKLPGLIRKFQTEAAVVGDAGSASALPGYAELSCRRLSTVLPLLTCARELRFELFALRSEERGLGNLLALVADQVSRHADSRVVAAAADCLVHVVSAGPGSLQVRPTTASDWWQRLCIAPMQLAAAQLALNNVVTKTGNAFASAAKAVMQLDDEELASEVEELAGGTDLYAPGPAAADEVAEGAQTLWRLHCAAVRVSSLLARNVMGLAAHAACRDALARLLAEAGSKGRLLGPRIMAALLAAAQAALLIGALQLNTSKPAETQVLLPPGATTPAPGVGGAGEGAAAAAAEGGNEEDGNAGNEVAPVGRKKGKGGKGKKAGKAGEIGNGGGGEREGEGGEQQQAGAVRGAAGGQLKAQRQAAEQLHAAVRQHGACLVTLFSAAEPCPTTHDLVFRAMGDLLVLFGDKAWGPASGGAAAGPASAPGHHGEPAVGVEHDAALGQLVATFWEGCLMVLHSSRAGLEEPGELEEDEGQPGLIVRAQAPDLGDCTARQPDEHAPLCLSGSACPAAALPAAEDEALEPDLKLKAAARTAAAGRRLVAAAAVARLLLAPGSLPAPHQEFLAVRLMAEMHLHGPEVTGLVREVITHLRRHHTSLLAPVALDAGLLGGAGAPYSPGAGAAGRHGTPAGQGVALLLFKTLERAYEPILGAGEAYEAGYGKEELEGLLMALNQLAGNLASIYSTPGVHRDELLSVMRLGMGFVQHSPEARKAMYMLSWGLTHFIPKLTTTDAAMLVEEVEAMSSACEAQDARRVYEDGTPDPLWAQYDHFMSTLQDRAAKHRSTVKGGGVRGALKGSRAKAVAEAAADAEDGEEAVPQGPDTTPARPRLAGVKRRLGLADFEDADAQEGEQGVREQPLFRGASPAPFARQQRHLDKQRRVVPMEDTVQEEEEEQQQEARPSGAARRGGIKRKARAAPEDEEEAVNGHDDEGTPAGKQPRGRHGHSKGRRKVQKVSGTAAAPPGYIAPGQPDDDGWRTSRRAQLARHPNAANSLQEERPMLAPSLSGMSRQRSGQRVPNGSGVVGSGSQHTSLGRTGRNEDHDEELQPVPLLDDEEGEGEEGADEVGDLEEGTGASQGDEGPGKAGEATGRRSRGSGARTAGGSRGMAAGAASSVFQESSYDQGAEVASAQPQGSRAWSGSQAGLDTVVEDEEGSEAGSPHSVRRGIRADQVAAVGVLEQLFEVREMSPPEEGLSDEAEEGEEEEEGGMQAHGQELECVAEGDEEGVDDEGEEGEEEEGEEEEEGQEGEAGDDDPTSLPKKKARDEATELRAQVERLHQQLSDAEAHLQQVRADTEQLQAAHQELVGETEALEQLAEQRTHAIQLLQQDKRRLSLALRNVRRCRVSGPRLTRHQRQLMNILMRHQVSPEVLQRCAEGGYGIPSGTTAQQPCPTPDPPALTANFLPTQVGRRGKPAARTAAYLAQHYLSTARLVLQTQVSRRKLGMCRELFVNEQCLVPNPHRPGQITTVGRQLRVVAKYLKSKTLEMLKQAKAIHLAFDGCTTKRHGKVLVIRVISTGLRLHLEVYFLACPTSNAPVESLLQLLKHGAGRFMELPALLEHMSLHTHRSTLNNIDVQDFALQLPKLRAAVRLHEVAAAVARAPAIATRKATAAACSVGVVVVNVGDHASQQRVAAAATTAGCSRVVPAGVPPPQHPPPPQPPPQQPPLQQGWSSWGEGPPASPDFGHMYQLALAAIATEGQAAMAQPPAPGCTLHKRTTPAGLGQPQTPAKRKR